MVRGVQAVEGDAGAERGRRKGAEDKILVSVLGVSCPPWCLGPPTKFADCAEIPLLLRGFRFQYLVFCSVAPWCWGPPTKFP